jgi:hypothetical protein
MKILPAVIASVFYVFGMTTFDAYAAETTKSVASINQDKATLAGQTVSAQGKVVKVNNGIMGRNFVHVQDGTGDANSNNLIVTSKQTANVGDQVSVSGKVVLNRDFGSGYLYPLLLEDTSITLKK